MAMSWQPIGYASWSTVWALLTLTVTYAANQWHAPMIALRRKMTFAVTNAENGTQDDCEEYFFSEEHIPEVFFDLPSMKSSQASKL